jgi:group I intron endonuclease
MTAGIYKITSPSNKVYIGQSIRIEGRLADHRNCSNKQIALYRSFTKYGYENHSFKIVHELPKDVDKETIDRYEQIYMDAYRDCGILLLNSKEAGSRGTLSKESRDKISLKLKGTKQPQEVKDKRAAILRGLNRKVTDSHKKILSESLKGNCRRKREIILTNIETGGVIVMPTLQDAARLLKTNDGVLTRYLKGYRIKGSKKYTDQYQEHIYKGYKIEYSLSV